MYRWYKLVNCKKTQTVIEQPFKSSSGFGQPVTNSSWRQPCDIKCVSTYLSCTDTTAIIVCLCAVLTTTNSPWKCDTWSRTLLLHRCQLRTPTVLMWTTHTVHVSSLATQTTGTHDTCSVTTQLNLQLNMCGMCILQAVHVPHLRPISYTVCDMATWLLSGWTQCAIWNHIHKQTQAELIESSHVTYGT